MTRFTLVLTLCLLAPALAVAQAPSDEPLSLEQITNLVGIPAPDPAIAAEIERRGLAFTPRPATLRELRSLGAGPQTLEALEARVPELETVAAPVTGIVQIAPSVSGAEIEVAGVGPVEPNEGLALTAGSYRVTISCPLCQETSTSIDVEPGRTVRHTIEVPVDPVKIQILISGGLSYLDRQDYRGALENAMIVLKNVPDNEEALALAAESAYRLGRGEDLVRFGSAALLAGSSLRLPVKHKRRIGPKLLDGQITLTPAGFSFEPDEGGMLRGGEQALSTPWSGLEAVNVEADDERGAWLVVTTADAPSGKGETIRLTYPATAGGTPGEAKSALDGVRRLLRGGMAQASAS